MQPRQVRTRGTQVYRKPALNSDEIIDRLVARGLLVDDRARARRYLRHIGYYRFSPYLIPFRAERTVEALRRGTTFDQVLDLYVFDRSLRLLVMDAVERIEVAIRSALTDHMSVHQGGPFWYLDSEHFRDPRKHHDLLEMIRKECRDQMLRNAEKPLGEFAHSSALEHYLTTYRSPGLPPSWLVAEMLSLGQLAKMIANLKRISDVQAVAQAVGVTAPLLLSWLRTYVRVRNICAHHGRLWNVGLGVYPAIPASQDVGWVDTDVFASRADRAKRLYPVLVSLQTVLAVVSPRSSWARRLKELLERHPDVPLRGMGIPDDWQDDLFWAGRLG